MITFEIDGKTYTLPEIVRIPSEEFDPVFEIREGRFEGVVFHISDIEMDAEDETLMNYTVKSSSDDTELPEFKEITDTFLIHILYTQMEELKAIHEQQTDQPEGI